jgi:hypothetical protein
MQVTRRVFLGAAAAAAVYDAKAAVTYSLVPDPAGKTLLDSSGKVALTYLTSKPEEVPLAGNSVCCFHPLNTPSGERVTDIAPPDHRDHRGVFMAWQNLEFHRSSGIVRGDFWGWGRFAPKDGRVIQNSGIQLVSANASSAEIAIQNDWKVDGETMMKEHCNARTSERKGARVLDLIYRFESTEGDIIVGQGAFTGLCVRCRKDGDATYANKNGAVDLPDSNALKPEMNWPAADWYSRTIALQSGKTVTAAVVDHPLNPESTWHEPRVVAFLNPCISALRPVTMPAGSPFTLRYRVIAMDGSANIPTLDALAAEWRATK